AMKRIAFATPLIVVVVSTAAAAQTRSPLPSRQTVSPLGTLAPGDVRTLHRKQEADANATEWKLVTDELDEAQFDFHQTLLNIDGATVEAVKYYLQAGVGQETLRKAYELTAVEMRAVAAVVREEAEQDQILEDFRKQMAEAQQTRLHEVNQSIIDGFEAIQEVKRQLADEEMKRTLSPADYEIAKATEAADHKIDVFKQAAFRTPEQIATY